MASYCDRCPSVHEKMDNQMTRISKIAENLRRLERVDFLKNYLAKIELLSLEESKVLQKVLYIEQSALTLDFAGCGYLILSPSNLDEFHPHISLCYTAGVYAIKLGMSKTGVEWLSLGRKLTEENKINESSVIVFLENNIGCAQSMLGNYYSARENFERAKEYMKMAIGIRDSFEVKNNIACTSIKLGEYSEAEICLSALYSKSRIYEIVDNDVTAGSRCRGEESRDKPKEMTPIDKESRENSFSVLAALCPERFKPISFTKEGQLVEENARNKIDWLTAAVIALNYARVLNHLVKHDKAVEILRDLLMRIKPWLVMNTSLSITIQAIMIQSLTQMGRMAEASMIFESGQLEVVLINTSLDEQAFRPSLLCVVQVVVRALVCLGEKTLASNMLEKAANLSRDLYGMDHSLTQAFANTANELFPVKDHIQTQEVITCKECENTSPSSSVEPNTGGEVDTKRPSLEELINTNTMVNSASSRHSKTSGQYASRPTDSLEESFDYMPSRTSPSKLQLSNETENELFEAISNDTVAAAAASSSTLSCEAMTDDTIESLKESVSQFKDHHLRGAVKKERELKRKREAEEIEQLNENRRQKASEQTGTTPRPASLPVQESDDAIVSCAHFKRGCDILFTCCNKYYQCHRCHNNSDLCEINNIKASDATHLRCRTCMMVQEITPTSTHCNHCKKKLSEYFCAICKLYADDDKKPYHCDPCGICRIHRDDSFHCDVCNACLDRGLQGEHKCRPDSGHDECCICLEDVFSGCQVLPCSHKVHRECKVRMIKSGVRKCPMCRSPY